MGQFYVAFFQETKSAGGMFSSALYNRFASEHCNHWGVAIWLKRCLTVDGKPYTLATADCRIVCNEPRLIILKINVAGTTWMLVSAHLPQQALGKEARADIFDEIQCAFERAKHPVLFVAGIDANARVPCGLGSVTGAVEHGEPDAFGFEFVQALEALDAWIPSTFANIHEGETATWTHTQGHTSRIDFICLGGEVHTSALFSWVAEDFDVLTAAEDHHAVAVGGDFWARVGAAPASQLWRKHNDLHRMRAVDGRATLRSAFEAVNSIPWSVDVNSHAAYLERISHCVLQHHFPQQSHGPRSSYISEQAWAVRTRRNGLKASTRFWKEGHRTVLIDEGFSCLAGRKRCGWGFKVDLLYSVFAAASRFSTGWIKDRIRIDEQALLRNIVAGQEGRSLQSIQKAIKRCGFGRRPVGKAGRTVPILLDGDGKPIDSREALGKHWLDHFAEIEAGRRVDIGSFGELVSQFQTQHHVVPDLRGIPTFIEVELQFRKVRCGAASGLDGLPPELFKAAPQSLARLYHPLMLKAAIQIGQPVQWRGGILFEAFKHNGTPTLAENYRSLFVSSLPGKCYQRITRDKAGAAVEATRSRAPLWRTQEKTSDASVLCSSALARALRDKRHSFALIFLDTKSAYYRVVRELAFGSFEEDEAVVELFKRFGVPPDALTELMTVVRAGGTMANAGMDPYLRALVQDIHALSWFVTPYTGGNKWPHLMRGHAQVSRGLTLYLHSCVIRFCPRFINKL